MERYDLTRGEYEQLRSITANKRAVIEMVQSLRSQLASVITSEDEWWQTLASRHNLSVKDTMYSIDHETQQIVGKPKPQRQEQQQPQQEQGIKVRPRAPEVSSLFSKEELDAMNQMKMQEEKKHES